MRDIVIPGAGVFLAIYLPASNQFEVWQLPLLGGMMGVGLVARSDPDPPDRMD